MGVWHHVGHAGQLWFRPREQCQHCESWSQTPLNNMTWALNCFVPCCQPGHVFLVIYSLFDSLMMVQLEAKRTTPIAISAQRHQFRSFTLLEMLTTGRDWFLLTPFNVPRGNINKSQIRSHLRCLFLRGIGMCMLCSGRDFGRRCAVPIRDTCRSP